MDKLEELKNGLENGEMICEVDLAMKIIGGKWKPNILWFLHLENVLRYGQLKKRLGKITPKILTQQLRELEECDMINRKEYHQIPPKVEYTLTERGQTIVPVLDNIYNWCVKNIMKG